MESSGILTLLLSHTSVVYMKLWSKLKKAIYAILGSADITDEELLSAVVGAEGLINPRPLTYQSSDPADLTPLTPNHFLHGHLIQERGGVASRNLYVIFGTDGWKSASPVWVQGKSGAGTKLT